MTLTRQEIFDRVATHLLKQKAKAIQPGGATCRYRSGDLKCAIGCLIPEDVYIRHGVEIEGIPVTNPVLRNALLESGLPTDGLDLDFLKDLQNVHDSEPIYYWPFRLLKIAKGWHLSTAVLGGG